MLLGRCKRIFHSVFKKLLKPPEILENFDYLQKNQIQMSKQHNKGNVMELKT